jgi:hypothetical protein
MTSFIREGLRGVASRVSRGTPRSRSFLLGGLIVGIAMAFSGCSDPDRQDGTQVEFDAAKQQEGMKRMQEYMQKKAKGEIPGIPKK